MKKEKKRKEKKKSTYYWFFKIEKNLPCDELPFAVVVHQDGQLLPDDPFHLQ
jgi:hypothetical protein